MSTDNSHVIGAAKQLLRDGCDGVLGLRKRWGHVGPYVFTREDDGWHILSIEPTMLQRDPIDGWGDLRGP